MRNRTTKAENNIINSTNQQERLLNAYESDYDNFTLAKAMLMTNLSSYDSDVLSEVVKVRTIPDAITKGSWGFEHTKKVFLEEVIPFINSLRASFKDFENGLHSELTKVKTVFNQMEAAVEQCSVDKKYFDIRKKELSLANDRLLDHIICEDLSYLYVVGALCYPTNDSEDIGKLKPKADIGIFIDYAPTKKAF
ncbi:hypothetical protein Tco_1041490 [Tanacetum coccineum]|uniref:Uncharacterized protein n=1 Tax=Tanacetum coccineum TaxID=301880 RepID=A0ABQ5GG99_9ASTR